MTSKELELAQVRMQELYAARAEIERLKYERDAARASELRALNAHEETIRRHSEYSQRHSTVEGELITELIAQNDKARSDRTRLAAENARLVNECAAAQRRADVLAEGVLVYRQMVAATKADDIFAAVAARNKWDREHGHMVSK